MPFPTTSRWYERRYTGVAVPLLIKIFIAGGCRILLMCCLALMLTIADGYGDEDTPASPPSKQIIGWLELIHIYPGQMVLRAKMDTGANPASLNATQLTDFDKNGEKWVRFTVTDKKAQPLPLKRRSFVMSK